MEVATLGSRIGFAILAPVLGEAASQPNMARFWVPQLRAPKGPSGSPKTAAVTQHLKAGPKKRRHMSGMRQLPPPDPQSAPESSFGVQLFEYT